MFSTKNVLMLVLCFTAFAIWAQDSACSKRCACAARPDFHAPVGVMLDHGHSKGQWMFSYRYMNMTMRGNLAGSATLSTDRVMQQYIMAPVAMNMQMHMVMAMYGLSNRITLMGMAGYVANNMSMDMSMYGMMNMAGADMSHMTMTGMSNTMRMYEHANGMGDTKLYVLWKLLDKGNHELLLSNGLNVPTGSISMQGHMMGDSHRQAYGMQPGTGTWAWLPGLTYTGHGNRWSWGIQATGTVNLGYNRYGYNTGNNLNATSWLACRWSRWISSSLRVDGNAAAAINGFDQDIAPYRTSDPMADTKNSGSGRVGAYAGLNFLVPEGHLRGNQLMVEYGLPVYQHVNGIQMNTTGMLYAGWQFSF